jgi:hypothetical protein
MDWYIHEQNLALYQGKLAQTQDEDQRRVLLRLIADETAKAASLVTSTQRPGSPKTD